MLLEQFRQRSSEPELMDGSDYGREEYLDCLADLRRVNRYLGGYRSLARHLFPLIRAQADRRRGNPIWLLDIGTGSADIPRMIVDWARATGLSVRFVVVDINQLAAREAADQVRHYPEILSIRADALALPFEDKGFDFVLASLFLHHFDDQSAARLLGSFARVAGQSFVINDLRRHPLAWFSIRVLTLLFTRNRLVRHDAAVSVLRAFKDEDIERITRLAGIRVSVVRRFPYRYIISGPEKK
ncbi:MAG: methyltransferase domain-containing protein [Acidobacteria bacterium]|nr:methyltransferase domain-containing protein [Acidobacteriota bacterium]